MVEIEADVRIVRAQHKAHAIEALANGFVRGQALAELGLGGRVGIRPAVPARHEWNLGPLSPGWIKPVSPVDPVRDLDQLTREIRDYRRERDGSRRSLSCDFFW
jgi:hypothetical protein